MTTEPRQPSRVEALLAELDRRARARWIADLLGVVVGGLALVGMVALGLAELNWTRLALGWLGAAVLAAVATGLVWRWRAALGRLTAAATLAERLAPELGTGPSSALDFLRRAEAPTETFSRSLAAEHVQRTGEDLARIGFHERLRRARRRRRQGSLGAAGGGLLVLLLALWALDDGRGRLWTMLTDPGAARFSDGPLVGDIRLTYRYPAYTGQAPRVIEGTDGSISAVVGTEVELQATADGPVSAARLVVVDTEGAVASEIPLTVSDERTLRGALQVRVDGRYRFALLDEGDRLEERQGHAIRAVLDAYPEVHLDRPAADVELKDDQVIDLLWRAKDDFGIQEVALVVEPDVGAGPTQEPIRLVLGGPDGAEKRREGRYRWSVAELELEPGTEARFYVEATDDDTISGPKKATSAARRLVLFSARKHHEQLLERERQLVDRLVEWLGDELEGEVEVKASAAAAAGIVMRQQGLIDHMTETASLLAALVGDLRDDHLSKPEAGSALANVKEHVEQARAERAAQLVQARRGELHGLAAAQKRAVERLERDIIYLDDLFALQRLQALKQTAKDLLAAQRELRSLLEQYQQSKDPSLRAALEEKIRTLREQMLELLARMASIKKELPGEYRNLESATALQMDDQLAGIEKALRAGDLDQAARELEQLANAIESMVDSINSAEEEYGGERYAEMRKELADFAAQFRELEAQQTQLAERNEELLREYRKSALDKAGADLEGIVKKARDKVAQALRETDSIAAAPLDLGNDDERAQTVRQQLMDLDALLAQRDFAAAREVAERVADGAGELEDRLAQRRSPDPRVGGGLLEAKKAAGRARERSVEVSDLLAKLFPRAEDVMSREALQKIQRASGKQRALREQADKLGQRMDALAGDLPLFGGEPRQSLQDAAAEMREAADDLGQGQVPGGAQHGRRAAEHLQALRKALEAAAQQGGGQGLPLPLGGAAGGRQGMGDESRQEDVEIPPEDPNRAGQQLRKELLDAAKQKAPDNYEEAVRKYYEELIK